MIRIDGKLVHKKKNEYRSYGISISHKSKQKIVNDSQDELSFVNNEKNFDIDDASFAANLTYQNGMDILFLEVLALIFVMIIMSIT